MVENHASTHRHIYIRNHFAGRPWSSPHDAVKATLLNIEYRITEGMLVDVGWELGVGALVSSM